VQPFDAHRRGHLSSCRRCRTQAEAEAKAEAEAEGMSWQQTVADQRAGQRQALGSRTTHKSSQPCSRLATHPRGPLVSL
jgi:hypothetical protein